MNAFKKWWAAQNTPPVKAAPKAALPPIGKYAKQNATPVEAAQKPAATPVEAAPKPAATPVEAAPKPAATNNELGLQQKMVIRGAKEKLSSGEVTIEEVNEDLAVFGIQFVTTPPSGFIVVVIPNQVAKMLVKLNKGKITVNQVNAFLKPWGVVWDKDSAANSYAMRLTILDWGNETSKVLTDEQMGWAMSCLTSEIAQRGHR